MTELEKLILNLLRGCEGTMTSQAIADHLGMPWEDIAVPLLKLREWRLVQAWLKDGWSEKWWAVE